MAPVRLDPLERVTDEIDQLDRTKVVVNQLGCLAIGAIARAVHRAGFTTELFVLTSSELGGIPFPTTLIVSPEELGLHRGADLNL